MKTGRMGPGVGGTETRHNDEELTNKIDISK